MSFFLILLFGFAVYSLFKSSQKNNVRVADALNQQMDSLRRELNDRLSETNRAITDTHKTVGERLDNATKVFTGVATSLGQLQEANRRLLEVGQDIAGLQELLRAPKFRGEIGENMLESILAQVLPRDHYRLQYRFKTGDAVDAVIDLAGHLVPVDSKFSLENFKKMTQATQDTEKKGYQKKFRADVKMRIDEIASKYILPDEGTFDFALMYIFAENVYYETVIKGDILNYALSKKVIPVSPNTFYAYLQVICLGLRGMKIESHVRKVIENLNRLQGDLGKFKGDFTTLGNHLRNAAGKYEEADKRLEKFSDKLAGVESLNKLEKME